MKTTLLLAMALMAQLLTAQSVIYVDSAANGSNNGLSWQHAYNDLQMGLEAAQAGDEIWVAKGTYYPSKDTNNVIPLNPRRKFFILVDSVGIYGGFAGNEIQRKQRDWRVNTTTLSGDIGIKGDSTDNSFHVVFSLDDTLSDQTVLDGFTISAGVADGSWQENAEVGGGVAIYGPGNVRFINLTVVNNFGKTGGGLAIYRHTGNSPVYTRFLNRYSLVNCVFYNNKGGYGHGIYLRENSASFVNCQVDNNFGVGSYDKGAVYLVISAVQMVHCTIANNANNAQQNPGIRNIGPVHFEASNCIIRDVSYFNLDNTWDNKDVKIQNCMWDGSGGSSNWQLSAIATDKGGNIDVFPNFRSSTDLRLQHNSVARNAGLSSLLPFDTLDIRCRWDLQ